MWSRKPMPVEISDAPVPSSATRPLILVSLVLRSTVAIRTASSPYGTRSRPPPPFNKNGLDPLLHAHFRRKRRSSGSCPGAPDQGTTLDCASPDISGRFHVLLPS